MHPPLQYPMSFDKPALVAKILKTLQHDLDALIETSNIAKEAATAEESKAENKYDTRGLEASYLAGAQSKRALVLQEQIYNLTNLKLKIYSDDTAIASTAIVEVSANDKTMTFFLLPTAGGLSIKSNGKEIKTLTVEAPLGRELLDKLVGDEVTLQTGDKTTVYEILNVF